MIIQNTPESAREFWGKTIIENERCRNRNCLHLGKNHRVRFFHQVGLQENIHNHVMNRWVELLYR